MVNGRIESYIHSDRTTAHKAGVLVKVTCQSEAGSRTQQFIDFGKRVAMLTCGYIAPAEEVMSSVDWDTLVDKVGYTGENTQTLETERAALSKSLKEEVAIVDIVLLAL